METKFKIDYVYYIITIQKITKHHAKKAHCSMLSLLLSSVSYKILDLSQS